MLKRIEKADDVSQDVPASGRSIATADEYRFIAKDGGYATPWRLVPKGGIGDAMRRLTDEQRKKLGDDYSGQFRGPSVRRNLQ